MDCQGLKTDGAAGEKVICFHHQSNSQTPEGARSKASGNKAIGYSGVLVPSLAQRAWSANRLNPPSGQPRLLRCLNKSFEAVK